MSWKDKVLKYIKNAKKQVVKINTSEKTIVYNEKVMQRFRVIESLSESNHAEELVRAYLTTKLVNELNYKIDRIEFEREYETAGRKKQNKPRIDLILKDEDDNIFFFVELKAPTKYEIEKESAIEKQLYLVANNETKSIKYLVYYTVVERNNELIDELVIIDKEKYPTFEEWKAAGEISSSDTLPSRYEKALKEPYIKGGKKDLYKNIGTFELDGLRENLHNVLWGGGGTDDNEIFSSLVNIILAKIQDEKERNRGEQYHFQVLQFSNEDESKIEKESPEEVYKRINSLYRRALIRRMNIEEVKANKSNVINEEKFALSKLMYTVQQLERYSFTESLSNMKDGTDILGNFFEGIIRRGFKQSEGQFFTPHNIVQFLLYGLELDRLSIEKLNTKNTLPYIIDPSAGSGTFLIESMKMITKTIKYKNNEEIFTNEDVQEKLKELMPMHKENTWAKDYLYGVEINFNLGTAIKVNMILHGDGNTNIFIKDGLVPFRYYKNAEGENLLNSYKSDSKTYYGKDVNGMFDVIISNPPFSVDLDNETKRFLKNEFLFGEKKNSENLFIERWYQLLKENGRIGVVLPESVFDTAENKYIRIFLYKFFNIKGIISLPTLTFEDYTSTKTSVLFASKKTQSEIKKWDSLWNKHSKAWSNLKTRIENYKKVYFDNEDKSKFPSIKNDDDAMIIENIKRYLKEYYEEDSEDELTVQEILNKYKDELDLISKYDNDLVDYFGHVNIWWVFGEVSKELDYKVFMAEADNVGYKKTKVQYLKMPNDLYDLEIAPGKLNLSEIEEEYSNTIKEKVDSQNENNKKLLNLYEKEKASKSSKEKEKYNKNIEKVLSINAVLSEEIEEIEKEYENLLQIVSYYYDDNGVLKEEFHDRDETELISLFDENGLLNKYKSNDVLLRKSNKVKILDYLRGAKIWE